MFHIIKNTSDYITRAPIETNKLVLVAKLIAILVSIFKIVNNSFILFYLKQTKRFTISVISFENADTYKTKYIDILKSLLDQMVYPLES